jgi:chorismate dehydratase
MNDLQSIRISVVSYLNSKPFLYGLKNFAFGEKTEIQEDIPSVCADKLMNGTADIGLVPVAVLPSIKNHTVISDYCIGADGEVNSVLLLSDVPLKKIKTVLLDYQSRTSVLLTRVLAENFWKIEPEWKSTEKNYEANISGFTSGVVIGDRALKLKKDFRYVYDLSLEWKKFTQLPFVFACWVSTRKFENDFLSEFNSALKSGLDNINHVAEVEADPKISKEEIIHYLRKNIDFNFDEKKKEALRLFLKLSSEIRNNKFTANSIS